MAYVSDFERQAINKGMQQGMQQGRNAEAAAMLERLLERRFGELPQGIRQRIEDESAKVIETWFDRAITASGFAEVFAEPESPLH